MEENEFLRQRLRLTQILAGAFIISVLVYLGVGRVMLKMGAIDPPAGKVAPWFRIAFACLSLAGVIMSLVMRRFLLDPERIPKKADPPPGATVSGPPGPESGISFLAQRFLVAHVVSLALAEAVGIYGLVLLLVTGDLWGFYALLGLALLVMLAQFPRAETLENLYRAFQTRKGI